MVSDEARVVSREQLMRAQLGLHPATGGEGGGVQMSLKQGMTSPEIILVALERIHMRQTKTGRSKTS